MRLFYFVIALLLFVCSVTDASAGPGDIVADNPAGCSPLVVHFHLSDTCSSCTYSWNFGNSTAIVTDDAVSTTYIGVGSYTVTLTIHRGSEVIIKTMPISVFPAPTVGFNVDDTAVCPGAPIKFTSTSTSIEGALASTWNYGDGSATDTGTTPTHAYTEPGYFNVTLVATSLHGCINTLTKTKYIHIYTHPVAGFSPVQLSACKPPASFSFTNTSTGLGPLTYLWTFGNSASSTMLNPTYNYTTSGTYIVKDLVTDIHGCRDSAMVQLVIGSIHAGFNFHDPGCKGVPETFHNTSTSDVLRVWDYHDGSMLDTGYNPVHTFSNPGTYTVTLTIFNGSCSDTSKQVIHIVPAPTAVDFTMLPPHPCPGVTLISFTGTVPSGASVLWTLDSGVTSSGAVWDKQLGPGVHRIDMFMSDPATGCALTVTKYDTLYNLLVHASASPAEGCVPMTSKFSTDPTTLVPNGDPSVYPYPIVAYEWDFGDGSPHDTAATPTHIYADTGIYNPHVNVTTIYGCTGGDVVEMRVGLKHGATFTASPLHVCARDSVYFVATPKDTAQHIDEYRWDFGDGGGSDKTGLHTHKFTIPGQWVVSLTAVYKHCNDSVYVMTDTITVDPPTAKIAGDYSCYPRTRAILGDSSLGVDTRLWIFGDGDTSSVRNPVHNYPAIQSYSVQLTTYNASSGCRDTDGVLIKLLDPDPHLYADDTGICKHGTIKFWSKINGKVGGPNQWYVKDVHLAETDTFRYTFDTAGLYNIMLIIRDEHLCYDTATMIRYKGSPFEEDSTYHITVGAPRPGFKLTSSLGCMPFDVMLTDTSKDVQGALPDRFIWKFGDGSSDTTDLRTITHTYTTAGTFTVSDGVTDNLGCTDSLSRVAAVTVYGARATFFTPNAHPCPGVPVSFTNTTANLVSSVWHFGDDSTSTDKNPVHLYKDTGVYDVTLTILDSHGCTHSDTVKDYISVAKPDASFHLSDSLSVCAHLPVHFFNTTTGADSSIWAFGDGNVSVIPSPDNLYTTSGFFEVRLIAANAHGCRDTAYDSVRIFGYSGSFTYGPLIGCSPLRVHFSSAFKNVTKAIWDFADGNTFVDNKLDTTSHVYRGGGPYLPKLILTGSAGCETSSLGLDVIKVDTVMANFATNPAEICAGSPFHFVDLSTVRWSPIVSRTWIYDQDTSHLPSPLYTTSVADTYAVHLTAVNDWGCQDTINRKIVIYPLPDVTASRDTLICTNDTATLSAYGAVSYTWAPAITLSCTNCTTSKSYPAGNIAYTITGTDSHGCQDTSMVKVNVFTPVISGSTPTCSGESDTLRISGGNGTWISSNLAVGTVGSTSGIVTAISTGSTTITYSLTSICYDTRLVTVNPEPYAGIISGPLHVCLNDTVVLVDDTTGGTWSNITANTAIQPTITGTLKVAGMVVGTDTIIYSVTNSCGSIDTAFIIAVVPLPVISNTVDYICAGATTSLNITIAGGSWSSLDLGVASVDAHSGIVAGARVNAIDTAEIAYITALGCRDTTKIAVHPIPDAGTISGPDKICKGGIFTLTDVPGGGRWGSGDTAVAAIDSFTGIVNAIGIGTAAITYIVGPNSGGCLDSTFYAVKIIDPEFHIIPTIIDLNCYRGHDGSIAVAITNGTAPFKYQWSTGDSLQQVSTLDTGTYTIRVREEVTQCESVDTFHVTQPDSLFAVATALAKDICKTNTGSMTSSVKGGTAPYRYQWSNNSSDTGQSQIAAGTYSLKVTDIKGCFDTTSVVVEDTSCLGLVIHNGISPNGDGINDTWIIDGLQYYPANTVQVFDKWGDMVFEGRDYKNDWPGTGRNGALLPDGSYYFLVKLNEPSKTGQNDTATGTLLIKR